MKELEAHPSPAVLIAFSSGRLGSAEFAAVEEHLAHCDACAGFLANAPTDSWAATLGPAKTPTSSPIDTGTTGGVETTPPAPIVAPEDVPAALARCSRYRVLRVLGRGGMGAVYLAEHAVMERRVALKTIRADFAAGKDAAARFLQEIKAAARLSHPNIVQAFDADQADDLCFLVMEYVEGTTATEWVERRGPLPTAEACDAIRQAALGLQFAHENGFVHRDVKPHNLMRTPNGQIKILDFGLARPPRNEMAGLTQQGTIMGTPDYMAPEQARDSHSADGRADIYSLGCTLYFFLTGRPPFPGGTAVDKVIAHSERRPDRLADLRPDAPEGLQALLDRMLAKDPAHRFQTPGEVAAALEPFIAAPPEKTPPRPLARRRWIILAAGILLLTLAAAAVVYRVVTDRGEVEIICRDEAVSVVIKQNGRVIEIVDPKSNQKITLQSGEYSAELGKSADSGFELSTDRFTLSRDHKEIIEVRRIARDKPSAVAPLSPEPPATTKASPPGPFFGCQSEPNSLVVAPDGRRIMAGCDDGKILIWDVASRQLERTFPGHDGGCWSAVFVSADRVLSGGEDGAVRMWDIPTNKQVDLLSHGPGRVLGLAVSADGKRAASAEDMGKGKLPLLRVWDLEKRQSIVRLIGPKTLVWSLAFSPDARRIVSGDEKAVRVWDATTGRSLGEHKSPGMISVVAWAPDGRRVVFGGENDAVRVWDVDADEETAVMPGHGAWVRTVAFTPDGRRVVTQADDGLRLWDAASGRKLGGQEGQPAFGCVLFAGGVFAVYGDKDKTLQPWRLP
jgi:serine/threonine protein kinase